MFLVLVTISSCYFIFANSCKDLAKSCKNEGNRDFVLQCRTKISNSSCKFLQKPYKFLEKLCKFLQKSCKNCIAHCNFFPFSTKLHCALHFFCKILQDFCKVFPRFCKILQKLYCALQFFPFSAKLHCALHFFSLFCEIALRIAIFLQGFCKILQDFCKVLARFCKNCIAHCIFFPFLRNCIAHCNFFVIL